MNDNYRTFFGLNKEQFGADISLSEILKTPELVGVKNRFDYVIRLGAIGLVTGEVGSGKSTALRYALEKLHPSRVSRSLYNRLFRLYYGILQTVCGCPGYSSFKQLQSHYGQVWRNIIDNKDLKLATEKQEKSLKTFWAQSTIWH